MSKHTPQRDTPLKFRELRANLLRNGVTEIPKRGKGSHRLFTKDIENKPVVFVVRHHGDGDELSRKIVQIAREKYRLTLEEFYG